MHQYGIWRSCTLVLLLGLLAGWLRAPRLGRYLALMAFSFFLCFFGWELTWSTGWPSGMSVTERRGEPTNDMLNGIATSAYDAGWCGVCFLTLHVAGLATDSRAFLAAAVALGVAQNVVVTLILEHTLAGVGPAPLAPLNVLAGPIFSYGGTGITVGGNIMWVATPVFVTVFARQSRVFDRSRRRQPLRMSH